MEGMDVEQLRRYLLDHTDLADRFPNWSASLNLTHFLHVHPWNTTLAQEQPMTAEDQAEIQRLNEVSRQFRHYYLWVIVALGLPGNLASLLTFLHMRNLGSCVVYIAVLAVVDSMALVIKLSLSLLQLHEATFSSASCKALLFLANALVIYANWIVVALAAERFFAVYRPLVVSAYWTRSRAAWGLAGLLGFTLLVCTPVIVVTAPTEDARSCVHAAQFRRMAGIWNWVNVALYGFFPCTLLLACNIAIISLLRKARLRQLRLCQGARPGAGSGSRCSSSLSAKGSGSSRERGSSGMPGSGVGRQRGTGGDGQRQASVMLLVAGFVLVILTTPRCLLLVLQRFWSQGPPLHVARIYLINQVTYALSDVNHAVNFYLYFVSARHFRRRFVDLFRSTRKRLSRLSTRDTVQRRISDSDSTRYLAVLSSRLQSLKKGDGGQEPVTKIKTDSF